MSHASDIKKFRNLKNKTNIYRRRQSHKVQVWYMHLAPPTPDKDKLYFTL